MNGRRADKTISAEHREEARRWIKALRRTTVVAVLSAGLLPVIGMAPASAQVSSCTGSGTTLTDAVRSYMSNCREPRADCDPTDSGWTCSSRQIGSRASSTRNRRPDSSPSPTQQQPARQARQEASATPPPTTTSDDVATIGVGQSLPSGAECASRIVSAPETRPNNNSVANNTRGTKKDGRFSRVDGDFTGTTDEILQWAACKWGIDPDIARAQAAKESWWRQTTGGDFTDDKSRCHPAVRAMSPCPESIGLLQVRFPYHGSAYADANAIHSTAYNADYAFAHWRSCYEGELGWLNTVNRGRQYGAGDGAGCLGVWFAGRWYTDNAVSYINDVKSLRNQRVWETNNFIRYGD